MHQYIWERPKNTNKSNGLVYKKELQLCTPKIKNDPAWDDDDEQWNELIFWACLMQQTVYMNSL